MEMNEVGKSAWGKMTLWIWVKYWASAKAKDRLANVKYWWAHHKVDTIARYLKRPKSASTTNASASISSGFRKGFKMLRLTPETRSYKSTLGKDLQYNPLHYKILEGDSIITLFFYSVIQNAWMFFSSLIFNLLDLLSKIALFDRKIKYQRCGINKRIV